MKTSHVLRQVVLQDPQILEQSTALGAPTDPKDLLKQAFHAELQALFLDTKQQALSAAAAEAQSTLMKQQQQLEQKFQSKTHALQQEVGELITVIHQLRHNMHEKLQEAIEQQHEKIYDFSLLVLAKILPVTLEHEDLLLKTIQHTLDSHQILAPFTIEISSADAEKIKAHLHKFPSLHLNDFTIDSSLKSGEVWIDYGAGFLNASINTQIENLIDTMRKINGG